MPFHIVLHQPEIPNNTGNIGRTCVATGCALHLVHPIGFDTSEKACRRAGLDYWARLAPVEHQNWHAYVRAVGDSGDRGYRGVRRWFFSTKSTRPVWDVELLPGDHLVFGKETAGLPEELLAQYSDRLVTLPMAPGERSLNLATAVCAAVYEGIRQCVARGEMAVDDAGRLVRDAKPRQHDGS